MGARHQSGRFMRNRGIPAKIGTFPVGLPVSHVRISKPGTGIPAPSTPGHGPTRRSQPRKSIGTRRRAPRPPPVLSKRLTAAPTPQPHSPRPFAFGINQRLRPYAPAVTARTRSVINEHVLPHRRGGSHHGCRPEGPATAPAGPARRQAGGQQTGPQTGRRHPTDKRNTDEALGRTQYRTAATVTGDDAGAARPADGRDSAGGQQVGERSQLPGYRSAARPGGAAGHERRCAADGAGRRRASGRPRSSECVEPRSCPVRPH